jgi:putative tricarboxylic transport membrane protein
MWSVAYFSEGMGLLWLTIAVLAVLAGLGAAVHFSRMRPYLGNILVSCTLIALSLVFLAFTFEFPQEEAGPAVIPRLYIFLILLLSGVVLVQIFRGREKAVPAIGQKRLLVKVMAALIAYFLALPFLGYFLGTFLLVAVLLHLLSYPRKGLIYVIAAGWVLFSYFAFYKLMYIQLPLGLFEGLF